MASGNDYHSALLTLSGNTKFIGARQKLLGSLSNDELGTVMKKCFDSATAREEQEEIAASLLDMVAKQTKSKYIGDQATIENNEAVQGADVQEVPVMNNLPLTRARRARLYEVIDSSAPGEEQLHNGGNQQTTPGNLHHQTMPAPVPAISMALCIPNTRVDSNYKPFSDISRRVARQLRDKFHEDYTSTARHRASYAVMLENKDRDAEDECSVNNVVYKRRAGAMTWVKADGNQHRACDHCINTQRLCARLVHRNEEVVLNIYALPLNLRPDASWRALAFWIRD
ncbi:hypothetical protein BDU57DRAFT_534692 [Ampelomyces quisqualis]|uniref:Uncharacterized protein n=1 Tax=Ampelomyces quisqualis TaxID=50730 RepID=A0A6A5R1X8_AMPQU|nr:hypothetical protein BDU57DRAFT_534692 [Ampelomyces quisqualis]